jgi:hypothetical protein
MRSWVNRVLPLPLSTSSREMVEGDGGDLDGERRRHLDGDRDDVEEDDVVPVDVGHLDGDDESVCTLQTDVCSTVYMHSTSPLLPW